MYDQLLKGFSISARFRSWPRRGCEMPGRAVGGVEMLPSLYIQAVEQIARGDASAAWCMNQQTGCSMSAAYLSEAAAREATVGDAAGHCRVDDGAGARP